MSSDLLKQKALALIKRDKEFHALRQQHTRALGWLQAVDDLSRISRNRDLSDLFRQWPKVMVRHLDIQSAALFKTEGELSPLELFSQAGSSSLGTDRIELSQAEWMNIETARFGFFNEPNESHLQNQVGLVRFFWSLIRLSENEMFFLVAGYDADTFAFFGKFCDRDLAYYRMMSQNFESLARNIATISNLQHLNADLEEKETRFRTLFEKMPIGLVAVGPNSRLMHTNDSFQRYVGYTADELAKMSISDLTHPDDMQESAGLIKQVIQGERDSLDLTQRYLRKDGTEFLARVHVNARRTSSGEVAEFFTVVEDITEKKETQERVAGLEQELRHSQKLEALGRLAGGVAHDFNNLLTVIIANTRFVADELPVGDDRRRDLAEVLRAAASATELTGQLLSFSRRRVARTAVFEINTTLGQIQKMLRRTLPETIELVLLPTDELFYLRFSISQFEQLVFNLAVNAQHAMPDGGELTMEIARENDAPARNLPSGEYIRISVSDTGCGMTPEALEKAFEPFFTTKGEDGTGLGLSTCYGLVKQAGGDIRISSRVGSGTKVTVHLPRVPRPAVEHRAKEGSHPNTIHRGIVLAVEDQPALLRLMVRVLSAAGYEVVAARTAEQANAVVERDSPELDILVTDVVLPGFSGVELSRLMREKYPKLRVLLTSGYAGDECASIEDNDEFTSFLAKPFSADQLVGAVGLLGSIK